MNRLILFALFSLYSFIGSIAHPINGYKYIAIEQKGNIYDIEDMLAKTFRNIGFHVLENGEEANLLAEKHLILHVQYVWNIRLGMPSELGVALFNDAGDQIFKSITNGNSLTAKGDMRMAISKLEKNLKSLNYCYEESSKNNDIRIVNVRADCASWSEDSIKNYLRHKNVNNIEGIYKNLSNDGFTYRFAIIKEKDVFYGVVLSSNSKLWPKGDIKLTLAHIEKNTFDVEMFNDERYQESCIGKYSNRMLEITSGKNVISFIKIYPSSGSDISASGDDNIKEDCKATGSGILISGKIVVTNFHVIEDTERIEVALFNDGMAESFNAKVLVTDKTNDLALLMIKDKKFQEKPEAPFGIITKVIDVGTSVFTMGYPMSNVMGDEVKVTDGIISAKSGYKGDITSYQISAPIQPGNSGGALFDKKGNLVGITNAGIQTADNVGYAIKTPYLLNLIDNAPIEIELPKTPNEETDDLPELIKKIKPYIAIIKIY